MSPAATKDTKLVLGGTPRVDLLPNEIKQGKKGAVIRRRLAIGVVGVIVLSAAAYGVAAIGAFNAASALNAVNDETLALQTEQAKYAAARDLESRITGVKAAYIAGSSSEIDWYKFIGELSARTPEGATVALTAVASSPVESVPQPLDALTGPRIASIVLVIRTKNLFNSANFVTELSTVTGFVNAAVNNTSYNSDGNYYETGITLNINTDALRNRFVDGVLVNDPTTKQEPIVEEEEEAIVDEDGDGVADDTTDGTTDDADGTEGTED